MGKKTFTCGLSATSNIYSPRWARNPFTCGNIHSRSLLDGPKKRLPVVYRLINILLDGQKTHLLAVYWLIYVLLDGPKPHLPVVIYILLDGPKKHLPVVYRLINILLDGQKNIYLWFIS